MRGRVIPYAKPGKIRVIFECRTGSVHSWFVSGEANLLEFNNFLCLVFFDPFA